MSHGRTGRRVFTYLEEEKKSKDGLKKACLLLARCYSRLDEKRHWNAIQWEEYLLIKNKGESKRKEMYDKALTLACMELQRNWDAGEQADWTVRRWENYFKGETDEY